MLKIALVRAKNPEVFARIRLRRLGENVLAGYLKVSDITDGKYYFFIDGNGTLVPIYESADGQWRASIENYRLTFDIKTGREIRTEYFDGSKWIVKTEALRIGAYRWESGAKFYPEHIEVYAIRKSTIKGKIFRNGRCKGERRYRIGHIQSYVNHPQVAVYSFVEFTD